MYELILWFFDGFDPLTVGASELRREAGRFQRLLRDSRTSEHLDPARRLYTWLVAPYAPLLEAEGIETLVFVPGGVLRSIPLSALHDGEGFLLER